MVLVEYVNDDSVSELDALNYLFLIDGDTSDETRAGMEGMLRWCEEFTGRDTTRWRVIPKFRCIAFRDQSDAFAFRLRWC